MKSICLVVQNSYPADVRIRKYAQALTAEGHRVWIIAVRTPGQPYHETVDGVEVYRIPPSRSRAGKLHYLYEYVTFFILAFIQLNILDWKHRIDIVHVNTLPDFLVFSAIIQKLKRRTIILDMHEVMPEFFMSKYSSAPESRVVRLLLFAEKASIRFADRVITVNHAIKDLFETRVLPKGSVEVIMNTADGRVMQRFQKREHSTFNCVYHGTVTDIYGLDVAIRGFAKACSGDPGMMFHIYGDGPHLPELKQLAAALALEKQVIFHGSVSHKVIWEKLAEMDLGILASRKDIFMDLSFSNKLAEYIFLKIPVIHSDLNSILYYFNKDEVLFFEAGNSDELAEKIRYSRDHKEQMQRMTEAAYRKYAAMDWGVMSERYLRIVQECA